ncbi:hypothetical protein AB0890_05480 [Streptomyces sp. NPDC005406]|uniref:hypothetical protein n=1 Tax=Streptomyces sp. NPDC005406 TaxID=3155339 RepID=UPI0034529370
MPSTPRPFHGLPLLTLSPPGEDGADPVQSGEIQDETGEATASAPVLAQLESLALSMGTPCDTGAPALADGRPLTRPAPPDPHHPGPTEPVRSRVRETGAREGLPADFEEAGRWDPADDDPRYAAVSE